MKQIDILIFCDYYLPGYKAGGPIRTISNLIDHFQDDFTFSIVTRDRDLGDNTHYKDIVAGDWQLIGKTRIRYLSPNELKLTTFKEIMSEQTYDLIYLNSMFSFWFTIVPLLLTRLKIIDIVPIVLAPRGMLNSGAIKFKGTKKRAYIYLARFIGLYKNITWQASSPVEEMEIKQWMGNHIKVVVAPNLPVKTQPQDVNKVKVKEKEKLKVIFLSRISPKKNLLQALNILKQVAGNIDFGIYGPVEDAGYWEACKKVIEKMPSNIHVQYFGPINHDQVQNTLLQYDLFFFPTLGENFGHVILEALLAGCPVLISDQTPWRHLEKEAIGWEFSLNNMLDFVGLLNRLALLSAEEYAQYSNSAKIFGLKYVHNKEVLEKNRQLFLMQLQ